MKYQTITCADLGYKEISSWKTICGLHSFNNYHTFKRKRTWYIISVYNKFSYQ